ncbi:MAG: CUB domain-containing protein, partial [Flavobacteriales bacterium]|nr:CUB domain-containing protein [Flavobacteriales bacterium]
MKHLISIFIFIVILMSFSSAQDIVLMDGLTPNFTTCDAILTDGGFTVSDYANNSDIVVTICSNNGQGLQIDFLGFAIEDGQDFLTVYDGPNVISPEIPDSPFTGTSISTLTSTGTCLTFHFTSNETVTAAGWQAVLTCVPIGPQQECLIDYDLAISPAYEPGGVCTGGTNYNYCLTINDWGADSPSEFHGFDLDFGPGIDPITLVPVSFPVSCDGLGSWGFYESVTSAGTGLITGPGFFYDSDGDGDPGNNPGDACVGAPPWTFCFDVQIDLCEADESNAGEDASISITTYSDGESGAFNDPNCSTDEVIVIEG